MINNKVFWGIIAAAAVGVTVGLLFAPEDGDKTRKKIKRKTNSLAGELIDALEKSKQKTTEKVDQLREEGEALREDVEAALKS